MRVPLPRLFAAHRLSLHWRVGLVLTALSAGLLLLLGGLWLQGTRNSVHEEVEAATRVSEQWLKVMVADLATLPEVDRSTRLLGAVRSIGRVRANALEVYHGAERLHVSPQPTYKAGRVVPGWFADLLTPSFAMRRISAGDLEIRLVPDASRAVLDAWDELAALAGWAAFVLLALPLALRWALMRALRPLAEVMRGLDRMGQGRFDTRLPVFSAPELARLSRAFNGMADRLKQAVNENVRLESERELAFQLQASLAAERRDIARELHDELAQGITAVRALAGAIVQRSSDSPAIAMPAQCIIASTGEMQDGVRRILLRLRTDAGAPINPAELLAPLCEKWRQLQPKTRLETRFETGDLRIEGELAECLLRIAQEGLTNVVRHAAATRVVLCLQASGEALSLSLTDDGRGKGEQRLAFAGCGVGLAGMRERIDLFGGRLEAGHVTDGGFRLLARFPIQSKEFA